MAHSGTSISAPVRLQQDLSVFFGLAPQLKYIVTHFHSTGAYNVWAKMKPIEVNKTSKLTAQDRINANQGFSIPQYNTLDAAFNAGVALGHSYNWSYNNTIITKARQTDFDGYDTQQSAPLTWELVGNSFLDSPKIVPGPRGIYPEGAGWNGLNDFAIFSGCSQYVLYRRAGTTNPPMYSRLNDEMQQAIPWTKNLDWDVVFVACTDPSLGGFKAFLLPYPYYRYTYGGDGITFNGVIDEWNKIGTKVTGIHISSFYVQAVGGNRTIYNPHLEWRKNYTYHAGNPRLTQYTLGVAESTDRVQALGTDGQAYTIQAGERMYFVPPAFWLNLDPRQDYHTASDGKLFFTFNYGSNTGDFYAVEANLMEPIDPE